ncbi:hypothetical protein QJS10_CPB12g00808 [Acorus calamus]|uniref:Uncharacterized protein n=1 Tax=Acorus calamus TaxID=4465 RepID=A0AAV9DQ25_ACOCL|nr:hypothetical protein QJS10_CPB12g00808 [Acorus calamus]
MRSASRGKAQVPSQPPNVASHPIRWDKLISQPPPAAKLESIPFFEPVIEDDIPVGDFGEDDEKLSEERWRRVLNFQSESVFESKEKSLSSQSFTIGSPRLVRCARPLGTTMLCVEGRSQILLHQTRTEIVVATNGGPLDPKSFTGASGDKGKEKVMKKSQPQAKEANVDPSQGEVSHSEKEKSASIMHHPCLTGGTEDVSAGPQILVAQEEKLTT